MKKIIFIIATLLNFNAFAVPETFVCSNDKNMGFTFKRDTNVSSFKLSLNLNGKHDDFNFDARDFKSAGTTIKFVKKDISSAEIMYQEVQKDVWVGYMTAIYTKVGDYKMTELLTCERF